MGLSEAMKYLERGISIIPVNGLAYAKGASEKEIRDNSKKPLLKWDFYQDRLPSWSEVAQWFKRWPEAGIGIVTGAISGLQVIDIDSDKGVEQVQAYLPDSCIFPIAESPSGGQHWFFKCVKNDLKNRASIPGFTKVDIRAYGGYVVAAPTVGYNGKPYRWRDGLSLLTTDLPFIPDGLYKNIPKVNDAVAERKSYIPENTGPMFLEGQRDRDLFYTACCLVRGKMPAEQIHSVLINLCLSCKPPMDLKEAETKTRSALKSAYEQPRDVVFEVKQWCAVQDGTFDIRNCFNELTLKSKEQMAECRGVFSGLAEQGIIEREKGVGIYRVVDKKIEFIEIPDEDLSAVALEMPLGINAWAEVRQRNIIVVAGASDAGKTAMCLNIAMANMDSHKIRYQSSEMTGDELRVKLMNLPSPLQEFRDKVEWIQRSEKWWDLILPDAVNIIDYMEIYENFYDTGKWIQHIHDRLKTGIAFIALQKKDGASLGRGGAFTKEKARLYLSMDFGKLRIEKAKWWAGKDNPRNMEIGFVLKKGVCFENTGPWTMGKEGA